MNFLAHAYLSFAEPDILIGNMISDFVKGRKKFDYPAGIQKGIMLHRKIDEFTDSHPETRRAKEFFRPPYRLYSGAFVDVIYDHFLACDNNEFSSTGDLETFCQQVYKTLEAYYPVLPARFQRMLPYMKTQNWLYNYQFNDGLEKSLDGVAHRALYLHESAIAFSIFNDHYIALKNCYEAFFPALKKFSSHQLSNLLED